MHQVLVEKMGLPDGVIDSISGSNEILSMSECLKSYVSYAFHTILMLAYLYTYYYVYWLLGCCQWWNGVARRVATLEFDRTRKSMGVIVRSNSGNNSLLVKVSYYSSLSSEFWVRVVCR